MSTSWITHRNEKILYVDYRGKELGKELNPKVKKMAQVFAINGIKRIIANSFINFTGMQIRMFDENEMEKAKEYLVM